MGRLGNSLFPEFPGPILAPNRFLYVTCLFHEWIVDIKAIYEVYRKTECPQLAGQIE
jgi:hypothetical protein